MRQQDELSSVRTTGRATGWAIKLCGSTVLALHQAAMAIKKAQQALKKKAKTHVGQTKGHLQGGMDTLTEGLA